MITHPFISNLPEGVRSTITPCSMLFSIKQLPLVGSLPVFNKVVYEKRWYVVDLNPNAYTVYVDHTIKFGPLRFTWHRHIL